jgi:hypothetical protein
VTDGERSSQWATEIVESTKTSDSPAGDGDLSRLRKGVRQGLEPLAKAQRILAHHAPTSGGLHLGQRLVSNIDIT